MFEFDLVQCLTAIVILDLLVLLYSYVLFPTGMALCGQRRQKKLERPADLPKVTLIIPAHNEEVLIERKIENSLAIDYPDLEIIVASDGSSDDTVKIARGYEQVRLLAFDNRRGKTAVLNDAVAASTGEILCLCDANVMLRPDALWRLVANLVDDPSVGGVTGDVRLQSEETSFGFAESLYYRLERSIQLGESSFGTVIGVDGGMYIVRRELFQELRSDTVLDDFSVSMTVLRAGKKLLYEPTAIANENATETAMDEFRRRVRIGMGAAQVLGRGMFPRLTQPWRLFLFVSHKLLRWISPWLLLILLVSSIALSVYQPLALAIVIPGFLILSLAVMGAISPDSRRLGWVAVPFYFVLSEVGFAWGWIRGLFFESSGVWDRTTRRRLVDETEA